MGDIPERGTFRQPVLRKSLEGYFEIVKGDRYIFVIEPWLTTGNASRSYRVSFSVPNDALNV